MRTEVKLSKRLERIASFVQPGSRVADIGTDHGYVPIWLVQKGVCPSALAMDVRKGPLERAEEHVEEVGLSGKIELRLSDGLAKLKAGEADTVVIAGMGGKLTCRILEQGRHVWENWSEGKERLILSPQSEQDEVRHFLEEQGFLILREAMLTDEGKYYIVIEAARGTMGEALAAGAQVYITGDISHHEGIDAVAQGMAVIDAGHYGIEHIFTEFMEKYLMGKLGDAVKVVREKPAFPIQIV